MSLSTILIVIVFVVLLVYLFKQNAEPKPTQRAPTPPTAHPVPTPKPPVSQPAPVVVPVSPPGPKMYEMIDFENPRISVNNKMIPGSRLLILQDSKRANELRKRFNAKSVLDRIEFHDDDLNVIEVYRVVSDNVYTYMFPDANSDDFIIQLVTQVSEDPSETKLPKKYEPTNKKTLTVGVPPDLSSVIQGLEGLYAKRKSSTGPKAIDTHSAPA